MGFFSGFFSKKLADKNMAQLGDKKMSIHELKCLFPPTKRNPHAIQFYRDRLAKFDYAMIGLLNTLQRQALLEELWDTHAELFNDCLSLIENNQLALLHTERKQQRERCAKLITRLLITNPTDRPTSPDESLQVTQQGYSDKPAKYIGLKEIGPLIGETMLAFSEEDHLEWIRNNMSNANLLRLNWVWGGGLDQALLGLIPVGMGHPGQAQTVFANMAPYTGYMSFVLYYARLGIHLYLLTKTSLRGSWMNPVEEQHKEMGLWERMSKPELSVFARFQAEWEWRRFDILNDFFWASANMACFFLLVGKGTLGIAGNALTAALLLFDRYQAGGIYLKKESEYIKNNSQYEKEIGELAIEIENERDPTKIAVLQAHKNLREEAFSKYELDWEYEQKNLNYDLWFAVGLLLSFSVICLFSVSTFGMGPVAVLLLGVLAAAAGFVFTVAYHSYKTNAKIEKMQTLCNQIEDKITILQDAPRSNSSQSELNLLKIDLEYHQDMIAYHKKELAQQIFSETMLPASAFTLLVFIPLSIGLPILLPVVIALLLSGTLLKRPKPIELPLLDDEEGISSTVK